MLVSCVFIVKLYICMSSWVHSAWLSFHPFVVCRARGIRGSTTAVSLTCFCNGTCLLPLPEIDQNKDRMLEILEEKSLGFLFPLLKLEKELLVQIKADPSPQSIYKWIKDNISPKLHTDKGFVNILMTRYGAGEDVVVQTAPFFIRHPLLLSFFPPSLLNGPIFQRNCSCPCSG